MPATGENGVDPVGYDTFQVIAAQTKDTIYESRNGDRDIDMFMADSRLYIDPLGKTYI